MRGVTAVTLAWSFAVCAGYVRPNAQFLSVNSQMRPDVVAADLQRVGSEWASQARAYNSCTSSGSEGEDCTIAAKAFQTSCTSLVSSVVQASNGLRDDVADYMQDVCGQPAVKQDMKLRCDDFSRVLMMAMGANSYDNRLHPKVSSACSSFWSSVTADEKKSEESEAAAAMQRRKEQQEAQEQFEKEQRERQKEEEARVEAAKKKEEEAAAAEEVAKNAAKFAMEAEAAAQGPGEGSGDHAAQGSGGGSAGHAVQGSGGGSDGHAAQGSGGGSGAGSLVAASGGSKETTDKSTLAAEAIAKEATLASDASEHEAH